MINAPLRKGRVGGEERVFVDSEGHADTQAAETLFQGRAGVGTGASCCRWNPGPGARTSCGCIWPAGSAILGDGKYGQRLPPTGRRPSGSICMPRGWKSPPRAEYCGWMHLCHPPSTRRWTLDPPHGGVTPIRVAPRPAVFHGVELSVSLSSSHSTMVDASPQHRFKLLAFDMDGTLIDSLAAIVDASVEAFAGTPFPTPSAEQVRQVVGLPLELCVSTGRRG